MEEEATQSSQRSNQPVSIIYPVWLLLVSVLGVCLVPEVYHTMKSSLNVWLPNYLPLGISTTLNSNLNTYVKYSPGLCP